MALTGKFISLQWKTHRLRTPVGLAVAALILGKLCFRVQEKPFQEDDANSPQAAGVNARRPDGAQDKLAQLAALQETSQALVSTLDLNALLTLIVQQATRLLRAEGGILNLADLEAGEDEVVACTGSAEGFIGVRYSMEKSLSGWATLQNQPAISNRIKDDPRVAHAYENMIESRLKNAVAAPLNVKGKVLGSLVIVDKLGGKQDFTQDDLDLLVSFASQAAAAIENARLFQAEQRRAEQFRVLGEVAQQISAAVEIDTLVKQMAQLIQESFGYDHVAVSLIEGDQVVCKAAAGAYDENYSEVRSELGQGLWGRVAAQGEPILSSDVAPEGRFPPIGGAQGMGAHLCVPLKSKDEVIGVLSAASERLKAFDESDLIVFQSLAHQAAAAIENIRYYQRAQQEAVIEERSRLARELHDAVTQTIFSASLIAESLPAIWERDPQEGMRLSRELGNLSRGALAEMRTLLLELRPAALVETSLGDLLRQLGQAANAQMGAPVTVSIEGDGVLPAEAHIALYRIAQEALNNVVKHSHASHVWVRLCYVGFDQEDLDQHSGLSALLLIRDDGRGFDPSQIAPGHLGLGIMQERAQSIGIALTVESQPGEGAQISVLWEQERGQET
jgi:signal transduction histidine kinase